MAASASMRIRTEWREGICLLRLAVRHPMAPEREAEDGTRTPAHFIERISVSHGGETLLVGHWGPGISQNPYLEFSFSGAAPGDLVTIDWQDNRGGSDRLVARL